MRAGSAQTLLAIGLVAALAGPACMKRDSGRSAARLATVGGVTLTAADFKARVAEQTALRSSVYKSPERRKQALEAMIRIELLAQEARRRGLGNDPEVRSTIDRILVHKLGTVLANEADKATPVSESELRSLYEQRKAEFATPTRVRVAHLFLAAAENDPKRPRAAAEAAKLLQQIKAKEERGDKQVLELTASQRSEDAATKPTGGDLGYRTRDELSRAWGAAFADAALALKTANQIGPVVSTARGLHLVKLLGRHDGYEVPFESARSRLEPRLKGARDARSLDDLAAELKKTTKIDIDEQALATID
jgi:peptidyl-prolyl cis-trans isomerase C